MGFVMAHNAPLNARIRSAAREIAAATQTSDRTFALAVIYDLTSDRLVRLAASITRSQHDAEDAVSAAMVKVATRPGFLVSADSPWHYLLRIVRNEALVILRSRKHWSPIGEFASRLVGRSSDPVERNDEKRVIWDALASLPANQREVVVLKIWEQMTFHEIGEVIEISPSTAASRYRYALEKLSEKLRTALSSGDDAATASVPGARS